MGKPIAVFLCPERADYKEKDHKNIRQNRTNVCFCLYKRVWL